MRISPLPAVENSGLRLPESKVQTRQPEKVVVPREVAAPVAERSAIAPTALPDPERVTVSVDASRELVYKFVDAKTGEVISQTPPEQVLAVVRGIQDLLRAEEHSKESGVNVRG
jgi:hypothetical protein